MLFDVLMVPTDMTSRVCRTWSKCSGEENLRRDAGQIVYLQASKQQISPAAESTDTGRQQTPRNADLDQPIE
jgi:hypothetical protein